MSIQAKRSRRVIGGILFAGMLCLAGGAAQAADWHRGGPPHREWRGHRVWTGGYYAAPPVVYGNPYPAPYYAPPPVVYSPQPDSLFGINIGIR